MFITATLYSDEFAALRSTIMKMNGFANAQKLALELHAKTHPAAVSGSSTPMYEDTILDGLTDKDFAAAPTEKFFPVAWHIWHITRIEDIVGNILINNASQVFDEAWAKKINAPVTDTGNAMNAEEVQFFSAQVVVGELKQYRLAVGQQTRGIITSLTQADMRKKPAPQSLDRLIAEGCLTEHKQSFWLRDFWGKKTFGGLILLPLTRHQLMHLEPCEEMIKTMSVG